MSKFNFTFFILFAFSLLAQTSETDPATGEKINVTDVNGLKQGLWREYWDSEKLKYEVNYKNDLKDGVEMMFFESGKCVAEETYYKKGLLDGVKIVRYDDCIIKSKENYVNGKKNGYQLAYHSNGNIATEAIFNNDIIQGAIKFYNKKGELSHEATSFNQVLDFEEYASGKTDFEDTVVYAVFLRNPSWKKKLIIIDATHGMEPYIGQILQWHHDNIIKGENKQYVFFNDGDGKSDLDKVIGRTGGVYINDGESESKLKKDIRNIIKNGTGGDVEENDLEALYTGIQKSAAYKPEQIILIADNKSPVRDMNMLKKIKKPVKIILCGLGDKDVNIDYLDIARKTKGSIHTIHDDVTIFEKDLKEGDTFVVEHTTYKFENMTFIAR